VAYQHALSLCRRTGGDGEDPPVEELQTASTDKAPDVAEEPAERPDDGDRQKVEILESTPQETVETEAEIIVSPRRTLKPAPWRRSARPGPMASCRASGPATGKPQNCLCAPDTAGIIHSDMRKWRSSWAHGPSMPN